MTVGIPTYLQLANSKDSLLKLQVGTVEGNKFSGFMRAENSYLATN